MEKILDKRLALGIVFAISLSACSESQTIAKAPVEQQKSYQYSQPENADDGWATGHLSDVGINQELVTLLVENIQNKTFEGIDSLSIVKKNTLVLHEDFRESFSLYDEWIDNQDLKKHIMHSTSKSFVSALAGIAIQQGFISNVNQPFYEFFDYPDYNNWTSDKASITLENVLTMRLGLEWDEWSQPYQNQNNSLTNLVENNNDFVKALLDLPSITTPGSQYAYNTVASIALGSAIEKATNQSLVDFARQNLFLPLQIESAEWLMTPTDSPNTGSGLFLKTRDMAKIGQLYLNQGTWNGYQIIEPEWIKRSLEKHSKLSGNFTTGYGYQWWLGDFKFQEKLVPFYSSRGYGGQFVIIVPEFDLVIAFTAHNYDNDLYELPFKLMEDFILPAVMN